MVDSEVIFEAIFAETGWDKHDSRIAPIIASYQLQLLAIIAIDCSNRELLWKSLLT